MYSLLPIYNLDVSVVIPTYKPGEYLRECLDSLNAQTLDKSRYEVILILNGCGAPWGSRVRKLAEEYKDMRIRFHDFVIPGVGSARNYGIGLSRGRYIAFVDDDDYVSPRYLEGMLEAMLQGDRDGSALVIADSQAFIEGKEGFIPDFPQHLNYIQGKAKNEQSLTKVRANLNGAWIKLFTREIIGLTRFDNSLRNGEDALFVYTVSRRVKNLLYAPEGAVYYRRYRPGSAVTRRRPFRERLRHALRLSAMMGAVFLRHPFSYNLSFTLTRLLAPLKDAITPVKV